MEQNQEELFLKEHFKKFYEKNKIVSVPDVSSREFGYGVFKRKIANRNLSFKTLDEMNKFLQNESPLYFSYSNAYYKYPDARPMSAKELLKADIIYEFDADDLETDCREKHDTWECANGHKGKGAPLLCPQCGSKVLVQQWFCDECLGAAKKQTFRLLDFLEKDFNFTENIFINFSGKAGYHIHLRDEKLQSINRRARIELVDYLTGAGIFFSNLGYNLSVKRLTCPVGKGLWSKRLNEGIKNMFEGDPKKISILTGIPLKKIKNIFEAKTDFLKAMDKGILFPIEGRKSKEFWEKILYEILENEKIPIDRQTSVDLHKIIRVPETLHGETGFVAKNIPIEKLKGFDPFIDPVVFENELVKVRIQKTPKLKINNISFGPFDDSIEELPLFCAVYLIGKGVAKFV
jgi:DNA primase small subunit